MKIITNNKRECQGSPYAQGVVTTVINDINKEYVIHQTNNIAGCLGIGVRVYNNKEQLKQIGLFHSFSEHGFEPGKTKNIKNELSKYANMGHNAREDLLKHSPKRGVSCEKGFSPYAACAIAHLLSLLSNGDNIVITLHPGAETSIVEALNGKVERAYEDLNNWIEAYKVATDKIDVSVEFNCVNLNNPSAFFAIDSNGEYYTDKSEYNRNLQNPRIIKKHNISEPESVFRELNFSNKEPTSNAGIEI